MSRVEENAPATFNSTVSVHGAMQSTSLASKIPVWTKSEVITDDGDGVRTLTAAETNTVFLIDDAALAITLPTVSASTVGVKYKFIVTDKESTGFTIKTQGNTHYLSGYALISSDAAAVEHFVPNGSSNSEINLNGSTLGGKNAGVTGDTANLNEIVVTGILVGAGATWFMEAHLHGDGSVATPFADQ